MSYDYGFDTTERMERVVELAQAGMSFKAIGQLIGVSGGRAGQLYHGGVRKQYHRGKALVRMFNGERERHALERMEAAIEAGTWMPKQLKRNPSLIV